jgi:hypothetical protein
MVVALAESAKASPLPSVDVYWRPNYALIDHWVDGQVQKMIAAGRYDVVALQQGPTSLEINRDTLRLAARLFNPVIRSAGGVAAWRRDPSLHALQAAADEANRNYGSSGTR